ncbi:hypothetical protein SKAU_G00240350 [Synaphobranchus kaupii]|uniref:Fibronectin type-III domain-containing protein n=1 Tax=Synaphobranchus kaupii TaxID=118154 RepID=A0A9Q1F7W4_SYNKA|nr:hypothetical protein SKAU_G00240350 [Synaphobranchus kaupii]
MSLIWTLMFLTLASSGLCEVPAPVNLDISSENFVHLLTWKPGPGSPDNLSYSVDVYSLRDGTRLNVPGCEEVVFPHVCNLTGVLANLWESYYARVWANLGNQKSNATPLEAFIPMEHTKLDPPLLSVSVCGDSLCVGLRPPSSRLLHVYRPLRYTLTINNGKDGAQYNLSTNGLVGEKIKDLEPGRKYCVTATITGRKSASSQPQCAETVVVYSAERDISIALCALAIVSIAVMLLLVYTGFICLPTTMPEILVSLKSQDVHLLPSNYDRIAFSLLHVEATTKLPRIGGGQGQESGRNNPCEEDEEAESRGTGGAGYERRPGRANPISCSDDDSSGSPPLADSHFLPSKLADYRHTSPTRTHSQNSSGSVTDSGPLLLSLTGKGPSIESMTISIPPSQPETDSGPLSLTGEGSPSVPRPLSLIAVGLRPASLGDGGPFTALEKAGRCSPFPLAGPEGRPAPELLGGSEEGIGLNVNLESVMLAEQEEEEEEEEDGHWPDCVNEHKPFLPGESFLPPTVLSLSAAVTEPPQTQPRTIYTEEKEEEEEEEDDDDDEDEEEECSGYMGRAN